MAEIAQKLEVAELVDMNCIPMDRPTYIAHYQLVRFCGQMGKGLQRPEQAVCIRSYRQAKKAMQARDGVPPGGR